MPKTQNSNQPIFLGAVLKRREDWKKFLLEPRPHGSLKDPVKIKEDIEKKLAAQADQAATLPITAYVHEYALVNADGTTVSYSSSDPPAAFLMYWLAQCVPEGQRPALFGTPLILGYSKTRDKLRVAAYDLFRHDSRLDENVRPDVPFRFWYHGCFEETPIAADVPNLLLKQEHLDLIGHANLAQVFGLTIPVDIEQNALTQAQFARELAKRAMLF